MLALGFTTRYSGLDATLGLAFAQTGVLYPFFGTLLGWLGVALTGSDTSSNVLFGSLQRITAEQLGLSPTLMAAANSSGGVMGKMVDAQSIVVASTATRWYGHEGEILRYVFFHSLALACLVGLLVILQAYVCPFTASWCAESVLRGLQALEGIGPARPQRVQTVVDEPGGEAAPQKERPELAQPVRAARPRSRDFQNRRARPSITSASATSVSASLRPASATARFTPFFRSSRRTRLRPMPAWAMRERARRAAKPASSR